MKPLMACFEAQYSGTAKADTCPATLEMWTMRFGFEGEACGGEEESQRVSASWVVRIGWVMLMSRVA